MVRSVSTSGSVCWHRLKRAAPAPPPPLFSVWLGDTDPNGKRQELFLMFRGTWRVWYSRWKSRGSHKIRSLDPFYGSPNQPPGQPPCCPRPPPASVRMQVFTRAICALWAPEASPSRRRTGELRELRASARWFSSARKGAAPRPFSSLFLGWTPQNCGFPVHNVHSFFFWVAGALPESAETGLTSLTGTKSSIVCLYSYD